MSSRFGKRSSVLKMQVEFIVVGLLISTTMFWNSACSGAGCGGSGVSGVDGGRGRLRAAARRHQCITCICGMLLQANS